MVLLINFVPEFNLGAVVTKPLVLRGSYSPWIHTIGSQQKAKFHKTEGCRELNQLTQGCGPQRLSTQLGRDR
jgi:hypothetical protein